MHKFFVDPNQIGEVQVTIIGQEVNHIKNVLRLQIGDQVLVSDGDGRDLCCMIETISNDEIALEIVHDMLASNELSSEIYLFQGLPKKDKMEWIVQKSVELGAHRIVPLEMRRSIVKLDAKNRVKKQQRWQTIAESAASQSKRSKVPIVDEPMTIKGATHLLESMDLLIVAYENAKGISFTREVLSEAKKYGKIGVIIGPEGGFDHEEVDILESLGGTVLSLGSRILRTETAGLALLSYLMIEIEEDNHGKKDIDR